MRDRWKEEGRGRGREKMGAKKCVNSNKLESTLLYLIREQRRNPESNMIGREGERDTLLMHCRFCGEGDVVNI